MRLTDRNAGPDPRQGWPRHDSPARLLDRGPGRGRGAPRLLVAPGRPGLRLRALELAERGKLDEALAVARRAPGAPARMIAAGLAERPGTATAAMEAAAQAGVGKLAIAVSPREAQR